MDLRTDAAGDAAGVKVGRARLTAPPGRGSEGVGEHPAAVHEVRAADPDSKPAAGDGDVLRAKPWRSRVSKNLPSIKPVFHRFLR